MLTAAETSPSERYLWKDFPQSSHQLLQEWLVSLPQQSQALDFGAGTGTLGQAAYGAGLKMDGCDQHLPEASSAAYRQFWQCDLNGPWPFEENRYDAIVAADILEHLHHPEVTLQRIYDLITPQGCLLVSLPNVAHLSVRLSLLFGQFQRAERGILDKTHYHFYTLKTARALIQQAGFKIEKIQATPAPVQLVFPWMRHPFWSPFHQAHAVLTRWLPTLLGYQFLFYARRPE